MIDIPQSVAEVVDLLAAMPGTVAVVLGGSRALDCAAEGADWDLGLYYRGAIDLTSLSTRGTVFPPGSWGRVMNGGGNVAGVAGQVAAAVMEEAHAIACERGQWVCNETSDGSRRSRQAERPVPGDPRRAQGPSPMGESCR